VGHVRHRHSTGPRRDLSRYAPRVHSPSNA